MRTINTKFFRISYPQIFAPKMSKGDKPKLEYSGVALFPLGEDLTEMIALAREAYEEKWGKDPLKWPKPMRNPFRDQAERMKDGVLPEGYVAGAIMVNMKTQVKPGIIDGNRQDILDPQQVYAGCWCRAVVSCYAYEQTGNRGVAFRLIHIQKWKDDEPLTGRSKPQDCFEPIVVEGQPPMGAIDPTKMFS